MSKQHSSSNSRHARLHCDACSAWTSHNASTVFFDSDETCIFNAISFFVIIFPPLPVACAKLIRQANERSANEHNVSSIYNPHCSWLGALDSTVLITPARQYVSVGGSRGSSSLDIVVHAFASPLLHAVGSKSSIRPDRSAVAISFLPSITLVPLKLMPPVTRTPVEENSPAVAHVRGNCISPADDQAQLAVQLLGRLNTSDQDDRYPTPSCVATEGKVSHGMVLKSIARFVPVDTVAMLGNTNIIGSNVECAIREKVGGPGAPSRARPREGAPLRAPHSLRSTTRTPTSSWVSSFSPPSTTLSLLATQKFLI
eukprot:SAG31_NODE_696_length_12754_cov_9.480759_10_plen_313_part_00